MQENKLEQKNNPDNNKQSAMAQILIMMQQAMAMGANDSEAYEFKKILDSLEKDEVSPESALGLAQQVLESKNDYH